MRKFSGVLDWNNPALVSRIYSLFLGTLVLKEKPPPKPENKRVPANTRIRLKLMPYLLKSREAAVQFPACIQVIFDLLFGTTGNTNAKLKLMAVSFIHHVIQHCPGQRLGAIGAVLLSALTRLVAEEGDNPKLRASCYVAIGKLGLKVPQLVNKDVTMIQTFFEAMSREDKETQLSVQEAMSLMAPSFRQMERGNMGFVEALLATYIEKDEPQVRLVAVQYAGEIFPLTHEASRYILLLGAGDTKEEVANQAKAHLYRALNKLRLQNEVRFRKAKDEEIINRDEMLPGFLSMLRYITY
jgi:proteasome component ECM29